MAVDLLGLLGRKENGIPEWLQALDEIWEDEPWDGLPSPQDQIADAIVHEAALMIRAWRSDIIVVNVGIVHFVASHDASFHEEAHRKIRAAGTVLAAAGREINVENGRGSLPEILWRKEQERDL